MNISLIEKIESYVTEKLTDNSNKKLDYHNLNHTIETVESAKKILEYEKISDEEAELVIIAAWFHDLGYTISLTEHELESCKLAEEFLTKENYPPEKIEKVKSIIMATKMPPSPKNLLEEIICDADLSHLGRKGYKVKCELLRAEFESRKGLTFSDSEWFQINIDFFSKHKYFTQYGKQKYEPKKAQNLIKLRDKLTKAELKEKSDQLKKEKLKFEKEKLKAKKEGEKIPSRGVETMFRNVIRTHVSLSAMADSKAHIMISVNTLLLTAVVAVLLRKLDVNQHLIIPTIILTLISLATLVYAVIATRPKVTEGKFTQEDIKEKRANLLYFGNFYNMNIDDFTWGMKETISDKDYLYDSMIKDFYYLGRVLGKKYRYLRICYNIFMYGLIVSIFAFALAIILYPDGINPYKEPVKKEQTNKSGFDIRDLLE